MHVCICTHRCVVVFQTLVFWNQFTYKLLRELLFPFDNPNFRQQKLKKYSNYLFLFFNIFQILFYVCMYKTHVCTIHMHIGKIFLLTSGAPRLFVTPHSLAGQLWNTPQQTFNSGHANICHSMDHIYSGTRLVSTWFSTHSWIVSTTHSVPVYTSCT